MSSLPPPPLTDPAPAPQPRHHLRTLLAWLIVLGCGGFFAASAFERDAAEDKNSDVATAHAQLLLQARYVVGANHLFRSVATKSNTTDSLIASVRAAAKTPGERLLTVPVIAELKNKDDAVAMLDELSPQIKDPAMRRHLQILRQIYTVNQKPQGAERDELIARFRWLGKLALTWSDPPDAPERHQVIAAAQRTAIAAIVLVLIVLLAFLIGLVLFVIAAIFFFQGKLRPLYRPEPRAPVHYLESFAIYLLGMLALSLLFRYGVRVSGLAPSASFLLLPLILLWPALGFGIARTAAAIGWTLPHTPPRPPPFIDPRYLPPHVAPPRPTPAFLRALREIALGLVGFVGGLPILALGMITTLILSRLVHAEPVHPIIEAAGRGPKVTLQLYLLACGVAPMVEETFFRGALHHYLRGRHGFIITALVTSFLFAAIHPQGWTTIPLLASIGIVLSLLREWRLTLLAPMTAHALNNFTAATFLVLALS